MISGKNYIGENLKAQGNVRFKTFNPMLNVSNTWEFVEATSSEIEEAAELAKQAFKVYRKTPARERARFLTEIANQIDLLGDDLIDVYCKESGLNPERGKLERTRTLFQLTSFAELLKVNDWQRTTVDFAEPNREPIPKVDIRKTHIPLGPVAVFGASNFPLAYSTAGGDTASALAAGCPVIVKSHPMHAGTGELVASAIIKAARITNMPNGVFSNLNSKGIEVGIEIVNDPRVKAVGFTGSVRGGRALLDMANKRPEPIPVFAEMGSINPVFISEGALIHKKEYWAEAYADSISLGTGQFCTSPGLVLVLDSENADIFAQILASNLDVKSASCMLHPNIKESFDRMGKVASLQEGVKQLTSNKKSEEPNFVQPSVMVVDGSDFINNPSLHNEVFGPFSIIVKCKDQEQLINAIENLEGQLTGTVIAEQKELQSLNSIIDELQFRVGRIIFNGVPTGVELCASMQHGGPYPASTDSRFTAVGPHSINRWIRPITFQNFPNSLLPEELK